ncbi:hypothetical protein RUM43_011650 [Polyplax serrata]|uniref:NUC153 domain-containing protein n=1 Tax=Polyplax serrata TaxID=468196 RepID=A0AAN8NTD9_POLSC
MEELTKDSRFSHVVKDAKFRNLPKKHVKVKIDKRFQSMFHDKKFQLKYKVDKRGRSAQIGNTDNLKKYYEVSESESDESEEEDEIDASKEHTDGDQLKCTTKISKKEKEMLTPAIKKRLKDMSIDYARGEGAIFSDSSSAEESSEEEDSYQVEFDHGWGELDKDAEHTEIATKRLAVCNLDWDRIEATDLMVLFNSFLPSGGLIHSVTIYPSDYGIQRMKEEEERGPQELIQQDADVQDEEQSKILMEKLRKYQLNRLKYYYAVVVCNSPVTAEAIYNECDGLDYECSSSRLDLRFIPDDTTFEQEAKQSCTSLPDLATYRPRYFVTSALTKAKVDLTWDETDVNRQEMVKNIHNGNIDDTNIRKYLACSSSEDDNDNDAIGRETTSESNERTCYIEKYKALLADVEAKENKNKKNTVDMEVTWNLDLEKKTNKVVQDAVKEKEARTPFEQYLEKRKEKKKKKKLEKQKQLFEQNQTELGEAFSDDDMPSDIDLNDPYFKEELDAIKRKKISKYEKQNSRNKEEEENAEVKHKKAELELLMLDNEPDNKHFSLQKIQENEKEKSKRAKKRKTDAAFNDTFKIDVNDERFSALYTSHLYNIDPANPQFRATKATRELIEEKLKRREKKEDIGHVSENETVHKEDKSKNQNADLLHMVKKIKKNTAESRGKAQ